MDATRLRWWDGAAWTEHTMDPAAPDIVAPESVAPESVAVDEASVDADPVNADPMDADPVDAGARYGRPAAFRPMGIVPVDPLPATTHWRWLFPLVPLVQTALFLAAFGLSPSGALAASFAAATLGYLVAALGDAGALRDRGHHAVGWAWALLPPAYLVVRLVRSGRSAIWPLVAWIVAQLAALAVVVLIVMPVQSEMSSVAKYDGEPTAGASTAPLSPEERADLLSPAGMSAKILEDLRAEGSVVNDVTCPQFGELGDADYVTCRIEMVHAAADVDVQVTDQFPGDAFVVLRFTYDE